VSDRRLEFRDTREVREDIRRRVRDGQRGPDIADAYGISYGYLRNFCSQRQISLLAHNDGAEPPKFATGDDRAVERLDAQRSRPRGRVQQLAGVLVGNDVLQLLKQEAGRRGVSIQGLATMTLEAVATDDLFRAILDR